MNKQLTYRELVELDDNKVGYVIKPINKLNDEYFEELYAYNINNKRFVNGDNEPIEAFYMGEELLNLQLEIVSTFKPSDTEEYKYNFDSSEALAVYKTKKKLEEVYTDLDISLDNCQGCTSDLDVKFAQLRLYESILKKLGCNIETDKSRMVEDWYNKQHKEEEIKQSKINSLYEHIKIPSSIIFNDSEVSKVILDIINKINAICDYIKETDIRNI